MRQASGMTSLKHMRSTVAALWTGNLFAPFLMSGVAAILPAIGLDLGASAVALSLIMVGYNLGQTLSNMLSGRICTMFGTKRILLLGIGLFCMFSFLMGLAPSMGAVIPIRFVQGIAAGIISCAVTTLSVTIAPSEKRGQIISITVSAVYLGLAIGPMVCGGIAELAGWRMIFFMVASAALCEFFLLKKLIPAQQSDRGHGFDIMNGVLGCISLFLISIGSTCTFFHPAVILLLPAGLGVLILFIRREWLSAFPILDLRVLAKAPGLPDGMLATFINYGSFQGLPLFFSLYLQQVLQMNAWTAGLVLMGQTLFQTFLSPIAGKLADKYNPGLIATIGMAVTSSSIYSLALLDQASPLWQVMLSQAFLGTGAALFAAPNMASTLGNVPREELPVASGLLGCLRTLGGLMSHIIMSCTIALFMGDAGVEHEHADLFLNAMSYALILFGSLNLLGMFVSLKAFRKSIRH